MKPHPIWILIADGARARILESQGWNHGVQSVADSDFVGKNEPTRATGADRPGRVQESANSARHSMAPRADWHRFEKTQFAKKMAEILIDARKRNAFDRLVLVAPPATLGDLRSALDKATMATVVGELGKDLTHLPIDKISGHLEEIIPV